MKKVLTLLLAIGYFFLFNNIATAQNISTIAGGLGAGPITNLGIGPVAITMDASGNTYIIDGNYSVIRKVNSLGVSTVIAGNGTAGFSGDGGPATLAQLRAQGIAVDAAGNLYIADGANQRIRKINTSGVISTIAGIGTAGFSGDGAAATSAQLNNPSSITLDASGNIYVADQSNHRIRKINTSGIISTVAGTGTPGYNGDGIAATTAQLNLPYSVVLDASGNMYIGDGTNHRVRKVNTSGTISTIAGNGTTGYSGDGSSATAAQLSTPRGVAVDASGNVYISDFDNNRVRMVNGSGVISTVAGDGSYAYGGDGGLATAAQIYYPMGLFIDASGNLYIVDNYNHRVRKVNTSGIISTVAGNGSSGFGGDGGAAITAQFNYDFLNVPLGYVKLDAAGNIYIADAANRRLRKINNAGIVTTVAGNGSIGSGGDGSAATLAQLNDPNGIAIDASGNIYISDQGSGKIRKVNSTGIISTFAGTGAYTFNGDGNAAVNTALYAPAGIALDASGNMYVADMGNNRIRKINTSGIVSTVAGSGTGGYSGDGGAATSAQLFQPTDVAIDTAGNIYIADAYNSCIRKVSTSGVITTVAGTGSYGFSGDGGNATAAQLAMPNKVAVDTSGNIYIGDAYNHRIRKVNSQGIITTIAGTGTSGYSGDGGLATAAKTSDVWGLTLDPAGNIYLGDGYRVREIGVPVTPAINIVAAQNNVCNGTSVTFTATPVNGGVTPSFQWKVNGINAGTDSTGFTYAPANGDIVTCVLTSSNPNATQATATSNTITMIITAAVTPVVNIVASGGNSTCAGTAVTFTATPTYGGTAPVYQWKVNGANVGTNSATYNYTPVNGDVVSCTLTSNATCISTAVVASNNITMTVNAYITPTATLSVSQNPICAGVQVTFSGSTNLGNNYTYEYYYKEYWQSYFPMVFSGNGGGTSSIGRTPQNGDSVYYKITATGGCVFPATAQSQVIGITLTPTTSTAVNITSSVNNVCSGTPVTYLATPTNGGTAPSYQWKINGSNVGNNNNSFTYAPANGDVITCQLSSNVVCPSPAVATSNSVTMNIAPTVIPAVSVGASQNMVCDGAVVAYIATPTNGGTAPAYQWKVNGSNVGANSTGYSYAPANGDVVSCELTSNAACAVTPVAASNLVAMTVNPLLTPSVNVTATQNNVCAGTPVMFTAIPTNGGTAPAYQWLVNGLNAGGNNATYSYAPANGDLVSCKLTSNATCVTTATAISNTTSINVAPSIVPVVSITANPASGVAIGQPVTFTATVTNAGANPLYQWRKNGTDISGATQASYTAIAGTQIQNNDNISLWLKNTDSCGTAAVSNLWTVPITTGIEQVGSNPYSLSLYPNPNDGSFTVKGTLIKKERHAVAVAFYNVIGQRVYRKEITVENGVLEYHFELSGMLPSGGYLLKLDDGISSVIKFTLVSK